jgi:acetate kinase
MGFTPLAWLVMATCSGDVDPALLMWLLQHRNPPLEVLESGTPLPGAGELLDRRLGDRRTDERPLAVGRTMDAEPGR